MISLLALRFIGVVVAVSLGLGALWWLADKIGDIREAQVRAKIEQAINITNKATDAANGADEETLALAEKLRLAALESAMKLPRKSQCELTTEEASVLGRIQ